MTGRSRASHRRSDRELLAAFRALRTIPGPEDGAQARAVLAAASRIGREVYEVHEGQIMLGWSADTEGAWANEGMGAIRSLRPAQPRLLRTLAACIRCCWIDPETPLYPSASARIDDVISAVASLRSPTDVGDANVGHTSHARGALITLDFSGLIVLDLTDQTVTLGPVIAAWPERDISVLRGIWPRLPQPVARQHTVEIS